MGEIELNLDATELRLGLPGSGTQQECEKQNPPTPSLIRSNKRPLVGGGEDEVPNAKQCAGQQQVVGWPPVRSYRKNCLQAKKAEAETALYVKVSMDGAPYLRKVDLNLYRGYPQLLKALQDMFDFKLGVYSEREGYNGSDHVPTYEDKDGDWMLVGDVPWEMFTSSCRRLRIMKESDAKGLGCAVKAEIKLI